MSTSASHDDLFRRIKDVRAEAIEHTRLARQLAAERRDLMQQLLDDGLSQADIARELGVSRQAIQKMMSLARSTRFRRNAWLPPREARAYEYLRVHPSHRLGSAPLAEVQRPIGDHLRPYLMVPVRMAPVRSAPSNLAPFKLASVKLASVKFARDRSAPSRSAPVRFTATRFAPASSTPCN